MQFLRTFFEKVKIVNFWLKNADVIRTQEICHVIYVSCRYSLGKVYLYKV